MPANSMAQLLIARRYWNQCRTNFQNLHQHTSFYHRNLGLVTLEEVLIQPALVALHSINRNDMWKIVRYEFSLKGKSTHAHTYILTWAGIKYYINVQILRIRCIHSTLFFTKIEKFRILMIYGKWKYFCAVQLLPFHLL